MARYPLGIALILVALTGCSIGSTNNSAIESPEGSLSLPSVDRASFANVTANLDPSTATVTLPMDKYDATAEESMTITAANMYIVESCMKKAGVVMPEKHGDMEVRTENTYGIWVRDFAALSGYEKTTIRTVEGIYDSGTRDSSDASIKKYFECDKATLSEQIPPYRSKVAGQNSLTTSILNDAIALSERDADWVSAKAEWIQCLKSTGITMRQEDANGWIPSFPSDSEGQIRTAIKDVDCKEKTNLIQRIMDVMAQYQSALMVRNQAALNTLAKDKQDALQRAAEVLREHGKAAA